MNKCFLCLLFLISLSVNGLAQDIHFSQFVYHPLTINPATAGAFDGAYRAAGIFRKQWRSVTVPYNTFALAVDARNLGDIENLGAGLNFFYDQAGDSRFKTFQINFAGSWMVPFDRKKLKYLTIGLQGSFTQRSIDLEKLRFDSQYTSGDLGGFFDPSRPNFESFSSFSISYPDLNAGIYYNWHPKKRKRISAGVSMYNILKPDQSFLNDNSIRLERRINFHADGLFKVDRRTDALPQILIMKQGTYYQITVGGLAKYTLTSSIYKYRAVYGGIFTRTRDAAYVTVGMDINEVYLGLSYDLNYSRLIPASQGRGGWEIAFVYVIGKMPDRMKYRACPDFM